MEDYMKLLLVNYGYVAIGLGTFFEGELILILATILASQGLMRLEWVIVAAATGAFLGDIAAYLLGTWKVNFLLTRIPTVRRLYPRIQKIFKKFGAPGLLVTKFFYGLRLPAGIVCGMIRMCIFRYVALALIGCTLWASVWGILSYFFGRNFRYFLGDFQRIQIVILVMIALAGLFLLRKRFVNTKA
ncbi:DedA family protein [candidate division KSB1 bacterium]|nr:DedA family protein [candidate division KSB1 bacterium]